MQIWKYQLEITDEQTIAMQKGAIILTVQQQANKPCLWALVDEKAEKQDRHFVMFGTGHPIPGKNATQTSAGTFIDIQLDKIGFSISVLRYIGTVLTHGDGLVWHVFEG